MKVTWDKKARALYISLIDYDGQVKTEELAPNVWIDKTELGQISGIEVWNVDLEQIG